MLALVLVAWVVMVRRAGQTAASADLSLLARLSLVEPLPALAPDETPRVRLHALLRERAREEWEKAPLNLKQEMLEALLEGVKTLVEENAENFVTLEREEALIAGTLRLAAQAQFAPQMFSEVIDGLLLYLTAGGHWRLGMELLTLQLPVLRTLADHVGESVTLLSLGGLAMLQGQSEEAARTLGQALAITKEVGNRSLEGVLLVSLSALTMLQGQLEEAARSFEQALTIAREEELREVEGLALNGLGAIAMSQGRTEEATALYEQALAIARKEARRLLEGHMLCSLGNSDEPGVVGRGNPSLGTGSRYRP